MPRSVSILKTISFTSSEISPVGIPRIAIPPPWAMLEMAARSAVALPDISRATSNPSVIPRSVATSRRSRSRGSIAIVAPIRMAIARRTGFGSETTTWRAPGWRKTAGATTPIGPAPETSTSSPSTWNASAVWTAFPNGSKIAATSSSIPRQWCHTLVIGRTTSSAKAPSRPTPRPMVWAHRWRRPARQCRQRPHTTCPSPLTRSPIPKPVTLEPTSTTSPTNSWPITSGGEMVFAAHASQASMWRSVPQIPVLWMRIRTSLIPTAGSGQSRSSRPGPPAVLTRASMAPSFVPYERCAAGVSARGGCRGTPGQEPRGRGVVRRRAVRIDDGVRDAADPIHLDPHDIARDKEDRRLAEDADTRRGPGDHQVAGLQRDARRDERDQLGDREDHVVRGAVLDQDLAACVGPGRGRVPAAQAERGRVAQLVGRDHARPQRQERVRPLGPQPLAISGGARRQRLLRALQVARGDVVGGDVARHVVQRGIHRDAAGLPSDHDPELHLEVQRLRGRRPDHGLAVADHRVRERGEEERALGDRPALLDDMAPVVRADADDLARLERCHQAQLPRPHSPHPGAHCARHCRSRLHEILVLGEETPHVEERQLIPEPGCLGEPGEREDSPIDEDAGDRKVQLVQVRHDAHRAASSATGTPTGRATRRAPPGRPATPRPGRALSRASPAGTTAPVPGRRTARRTS